MTLLSPRQAASALGVSESSLKRWCDRGDLPAVRTAGGHRRLEVATLVEFARQSGKQLVRPELLGIGLGGYPSLKSDSLSAETFLVTLLRGDEAGCKFLARSCLVVGVSVADFADKYIATAFRQIGERWSHGQTEVYEERRACQICQAVLEEMSTLVPASGSDRPLAIGAAPEGDPYTLPTAIASLVLRQNAWRTQSLGGDLPWSTLIAAIRDLRPQLFWLAVATIPDSTSFVNGYRQFYSAVGHLTAVVVGGRALNSDLRSQMQYAAFCDNMQHLESFGASFKRSKRRSSKTRK